MLVADSASPPEHQESAISVSPSLSSRHAVSRSSTPGISSLDGTPRYLHAFTDSPLSPSSPPVQMPLCPAPSPPLEFPPGPHHGQLILEMPISMDPVSKVSILDQQIPSPSRTKAPEEVPEETPEPVIASLSEISHVLRLQKYHKRRCAHIEENLHRLQVAAAKTTRLIQSTKTVQRTLAECIRTEDKPSFVSLLHTFHDACDECLISPSTVGVDVPAYTTTESGAASPFLEELSSSSRSSILDCFSKLRNDSGFVTSRLASLTQKELLSLLPDRYGSRPTDSVLGGGRSISRASKPLGFVVDAQVDTISTFSPGSPLEALIHCVRGLGGSQSLEDERALDMWATVCANLIVDKKPGSERLVPAVLDIWSASRPWPGKERVEVWILQTLQQGSFLLEQPSKQTFRARVEGRTDITAEDEHRAEVFYSQAVQSLLDLLGDVTGPSVIPPGALDLCHAMWNRLSSSAEVQRALPHFLIRRWLFSTFVLDLIILPEAHVLLADHYIGDASRQRILREVAYRAQKAVFDVAYSWRHGSVLNAEITQRVQAVMARLQPPSVTSPALKGRAIHRMRDSHDGSGEAFIVVSVKEVAMCFGALYPQRRPASVASDGDNLKSGLQSSASSVSGFSLFNNARTPDSLRELSGCTGSDAHSLRLGHHSLGRAELVSEDEQAERDQVREAILELEELINGRSGQELWDTLYAPFSSPALQTKRERLTGLSSADLSSVAKEQGIASDHGKNSSKEHVSSTRAVEMLLCDYEVEEIHGVCAITSSQNLSQAELYLESLFDRSIEECEARADFVKAHCWFRQLQDFKSYILGSKDLSHLRAILCEVQDAARMSVDRLALMETACEDWTRVLKSRWQLRNECLDPITEDNLRLRDKMWYIADVRVSRPYDEARSISAALRVMGKQKRAGRTRMAPPLRHWNISKTTSTSMHLKTEAQILEILSAKPDHGGPNKLSDDQSQATELWMDRQNIDNLCRGEERLHKLCMELRKCVDLVATATSTDSTISNNVLFTRDPLFRQQQQFVQRKPDLLSGLSGTGSSSYKFMSLHTQPRSNDALSSTSRALSSVSSQDYLESRSPTLTNKSSIPFWSPAMTEVDAASSATSINSSRTQPALRSAPPKITSNALLSTQKPLDRLRQRATGLLLSDLTAILFSDGSETDKAFRTGLGWTLTERYFRGLHALQTGVGSSTPRPSSNVSSVPSTPRFGFESAFRTLLARFSAMSNPSTKLACLYDIDRLLVPYMAEDVVFDSPLTSFLRSDSESGQQTSAKRTRDATETSVSGFRRIFSQSSLRPATIFRDLQYIAALLPAAVLHNTPEGKAFTHAAVAISGLKQEARAIMVETADSIIAYHSNNRGHGRTSSTAQQQRDSAIFSVPSRTPSAEDVSRYSMADAGYLLQITAKEGDPVAQRELATLYLTHPDLMDRIVAPFARPRDVFKEELESKWRKNQDPNRCDPTTMCVAHHWMSLSSKGGDVLAKEYLRQREEMDSF